MTPGLAPLVRRGPQGDVHSSRSEKGGRDPNQMRDQDRGSDLLVSSHLPPCGHPGTATRPAGSGQVAAVASGPAPAEPQRDRTREGEPGPPARPRGARLPAAGGAEAEAAGSGLSRPPGARPALPGAVSRALSVFR